MAIVKFQRKSLDPLETLKLLTKRIEGGQISPDKIIVIVVDGDNYWFSASGGMTAEEAILHSFSFTQSLFEEFFYG